MYQLDTDYAVSWYKEWKHIGQEECHHVLVNNFLAINLMSTKITTPIKESNEMNWFSRHILYLLPHLSHYTKLVGLAKDKHSSLLSPSIKKIKNPQIKKKCFAIIFFVKKIMGT